MLADVKEAARRPPPARARLSPSLVQLINSPMELAYVSKCAAAANKSSIGVCISRIEMKSRVHCVEQG